MASKKDLLRRKSPTCSTSTPCSVSALPHYLPMEPETEEQMLHKNSSVPSPLNYLKTTHPLPVERSLSNPCKAPQHVPAEMLHEWASPGWSDQPLMGWIPVPSCYSPLLGEVRSSQ